jgi:hypothetical protein
MVKRKSADARLSSDPDLTPTLPRVVILEDQGQPLVKVLELPETTSLGAFFFHSGTRWLVADMRTGDRVLIARPARA